MDRRFGRLYGLGAAALLVAISFLATHASATVEIGVCGNKDCGSDAQCVVSADGSAGVCECLDGSAFNELENTCDGGGSVAMIASADPCAALDCGSTASCSPNAAGDPVCVCSTAGFIFSDVYKTCFGPLLRTTLELQGPNSGRKRKAKKQRLTFSTDEPADAIGGTTACTDLTSSIGSHTKATIVWRVAKLAGAENGMCQSLTFYSGPGCSGQPAGTIVRPSWNGRGYPVTKGILKKASQSLQSVGCQIA
ncbi:unnamed protein product [Closterium sp. NIES-53]